MLPRGSQWMYSKTCIDQMGIDYWNRLKTTIDVLKVGIYEIKF